MCCRWGSAGAIVRLSRVHRARDYNRFNRWLRRDFRLKLLDGLIDARAVTRSPAIDSSSIKAQRCAFGGKRGRSDQAIGRSRGGWSTKIPALTDVIARPFALMLTPGNISDVSAVPALLEKTRGMRYLPGDKGYDPDQLRRTLRQACRQLPARRGPRNSRRILAVNEAQT